MSTLELRNAQGELRAFEIPETATSFGALCSEISKVSGVCFHGKKRLMPYQRPASFHFKGHEYEVCIISGGLWVGPVAAEVAYPELGEIYEHIKLKVLRSAWHKVLAKALPG